MEHRYEKHWEHKEYKIIECMDCGFKHLYPVPEKESMKEFYDEKYYSEIKPFYYKNVTEDFILRKSEEVDDNKIYGAIYDKVGEYKRAYENVMVDIGSGNDLLALYFQNKEWEVCVVEPNIKAAEYLNSYNLNVINDYMENIQPEILKGSSFINVQFVLEHIHNPAAFLEKAYRMLVPGGIIRICVPNDFSEGQMAFKEYHSEAYRWIVLPDHINYFNINSLSGLLSRTGFRELYRTTDFPLEILLMGGMNYYTEEEYKKQVGPFIYNFENSLKSTGRKQLLDRFYEGLANIGMGRSIYMYAIKE